MGVRLAAMYARAGRSVVLGSRCPQRARRIVDALAIPGLRRAATGGVAGRYVLPAVFLRDGLTRVLESLRAIVRQVDDRHQQPLQ